MLRDRKPLKTYVASEAILLPGSALVLFLGRSSMTDVVAKTVFYVFESALPLTWAVRLLWLEHKARRSRPRPIPVSRTKPLGVYLSFVSVYQLLYVIVFSFRFELFGGLLGRVDFSHFDDGKFGHIKGPANDLTIQVLFALHPRLALWIFSGVVNDVLQLGGQLSSSGLFGTSLLLGLAFAIFLIRGYQPLKTYLTFETLFGVPNALLLLCGVLWSIGNEQLAISSGHGSRRSSRCCSFPLCLVSGPFVCFDSEGSKLGLELEHLNPATLGACRQQLVLRSPDRRWRGLPREAA
jgi:hypothetical protein